MFNFYAFKTFRFAGRICPRHETAREGRVKTPYPSFRTTVQVLRSPRKMEPCFPFSLPVLPFKGNGGDSRGSRGINGVALLLPTRADGAAQGWGGDEGEV